MKFKQFLREEYSFSYTDPINKDRIEVFINPTKNELKGKSMFRGVMLPSGNWFIALKETLHDFMASEIKDNLPEFKAEIYGHSKFIVCFWEDGKLVVQPYFEFEDEQDVEEFKDVVNKCLKDKGIPYKIEVKE
jgi:hypothetical protein